MTLPNFDERLRDELYDLSEHQIEGVKKGFVTDFYVEEKFQKIKAILSEFLPEEMIENAITRALGPIFSETISEKEGIIKGWNDYRAETKRRLGLE